MHYSRLRGAPTSHCENNPSDIVGSSRSSLRHNQREKQFLLYASFVRAQMKVMACLDYVFLMMNIPFSLVKIKSLHKVGILAHKWH